MARDPLDTSTIDAFPHDPCVEQQPKRCTEREKCQGELTRYDTVSSGLTSITLKCRACGAIVRHDWD